MRKSVCLRHEVNIKDIENLIAWLENGSVTKYLNERPDAARSLRELKSGADEGLFTCHLNRDGIFNLICERDTGDSIGFIRLQPLSSGEYEIVYAIGEEKLWGQGLGGMALDEALSRAFFDERAKSVVAHIHPDNKRSLGMMKRSGFREVKSGATSVSFALTMPEYLHGKR